MTLSGRFETVFVSGGAGFIGSHLLQRLLADPSLQRVVVYDNFSSGRESHLAGFEGDARLQVVRGDLTAKEGLAEAMRGCEAVFHLAANPDLAKAATQPDIDFREGTCLTQHVLEAMRLTGARRMFYMSGSGVYGENAKVTFAEDYGPCRPISPYGASKLAGEALISAYCHMFGLIARVFRFANVVGPRQGHGVGYDFVRRLLADPTRLRILGNGSQSKSYIHVDDVLEAVFMVVAQPGPEYDVFNVATEDYLSVSGIADMAVEACGLERSRVRYEFTGGDRGWKGDVPVVRFNCAKLRALGWRNQRTSTEAMRDSLAAIWAGLKQGEIA
jgi:UDP-glucose 4-epimerase